MKTKQNKTVSACLKMASNSKMVPEEYETKQKAILDRDHLIHIHNTGPEFGIYQPCASSKNHTLFIPV